jgi:hypothetical protein
MSIMSVNAVSAVFTPPPPHSEQGEVVAPPHSEQGLLSAPPHSEQGELSVPPPHSEQGDAAFAPPHSEQGELRSALRAMNARRGAAAVLGMGGASEPSMEGVRGMMLRNPTRAAAGLAAAVSREHAAGLLT